LKFLKIDIEKDMEQIIYAIYSGAAFDDDIVIKSFLHYFLYANTIKNFQSNPTHKVWLRRAMELKDIGCFGLTEFYHGSYNKGMEMLAKYDHEKSQFVLTSQGQKGMKFWIGGAA
jgi:alkylation response protein AidB-like acyl-CoA dehydrogenase